MTISQGQLFTNAGIAALGSAIAKITAYHFIYLFIFLLELSILSYSDAY